MSAPAKQRLYLDNGNTNPAIDLAPIQSTLQPLFVRWVLSNWYERDFLEAVEHVGTLIFAEYLLSGSPDMAGAHLPLPALPPFRAAADDGAPRLRFHDENGDLDPRIRTDALHGALASLFVAWLAKGCAPRDFIQAGKDVASSIHHSYSISCAMNGLGGGKTKEEFLSAPSMG